MAPSTLLSQNHLLASLPRKELQRWLQLLEPVHLILGQTLYEAGKKVQYVYFPTTSIVSLLCQMNNGASAEVAVVGNEGVVGVSPLLCGETSTTTAVVRNAGGGLRLDCGAVDPQLIGASEFMAVLLRYLQALIAQIAQNAICNRHHTLDQQLCKWLLASLDRLKGNEVFTTQDVIARLLGVRRAGVTDSALKLQLAEVIRYSRGHIAVLDRVRLESHACECYGVVKKEYDRLFSQIATNRVLGTVAD